MPHDMVEEGTAGLGGMGGREDIARALGSPGLLTSITEVMVATTVLSPALGEPQFFLSHSALERMCPVAVGAASPPALPRSGRVSVCQPVGSTRREVLLTASPSWKEVQEEEQVCKR